MEYVETFAKIKENRPFKMRKVARESILSVLSAVKRIKGLKKEFQKPRINFLYFHHIFKDEKKNFELLLGKLSEQHTFISYSEAVEKIISRDIDRPYIVMSSDDGLKNNLVAAKILNQFGVQACFFINPYIIGKKDFNEVEKYCHKQLNFPPVRFLDWSDVEKLQKMGHEIGSHTMKHINIAETPMNLVRKDMEKTAEILIQKCGIARHFAFPYGRFKHFTNEARKIVFETGFTSCASAERGSHLNPERKMSKDELCIRRDHVLFDWNINHILYFIARSAETANVNNNFFPY